MSECYYADSSALVKRYISEIVSRKIEQEFDSASGNKVISAKLSVIEVLSAMNRRQREADTSAAEYTKFFGDFLSFVETEYEMIELSDAVLVEAQRLLKNYSLRAGDAVQLASLVLANTQFLSANLSALISPTSDVRLLSAASDEGLNTDDPQNHP